jgi:ketosteroid isomerase-like protein
MSRENVEAVHATLKAFNCGDDDAVIAGFHADCEIHHPPELPDAGVVYRGTDGVREWMANLREVVGMELRFGRRAKPQAAMSCSSKLGEAAWARAAGVPIEWTTFLVFDMRNGRIARGRGFLRKPPALEAAGLRE